ncbi:MAG: type II toxin-antitoxin system RelE/ParE family toxin [Gemmatimonadaceae bacterium]|jgi:hypothetical protein|nr:type II toxin-antitoxin system RelE/ParE family toxin [Gemmatimonadaceae bacterium]
MPPCEVRIFQKANDDVPFREWLQTLTMPSKAQHLEAVASIRALLEALGKQGHALRRPQSAPLREGIHELRARVRKVNYRVLYLFAGQGVAVIALGCTKEGEVNPADLKRAVQYKTLYEKDPQKHTYRP